MKKENSPRKGDPASDLGGKKVVRGGAEEGTKRGGVEKDVAEKVEGKTSRGALPIKARY